MFLHLCYPFVISKQLAMPDSSYFTTYEYYLVYLPNTYLCYIPESLNIKYE
jgi:hypothetical protein